MYKEVLLFDNLCCSFLGGGAVHLTHCSVSLGFQPLSFGVFLRLPSSGQSYEIRMLDNRKQGEFTELNNKMVKVRPSSQPEDRQTSSSERHNFDFNGICARLFAEHRASGVP